MKKVRNLKTKQRIAVKRGIRSRLRFKKFKRLRHLGLIDMYLSQKHGVKTKKVVIQDYDKKVETKPTFFERVKKFLKDVKNFLRHVWERNKRPSGSRGDSKEERSIPNDSRPSGIPNDNQTNSGRSMGSVR